MLPSFMNPLMLVAIKYSKVRRFSAFDDAEDGIRIHQITGTFGLRSDKIPESKGIPETMSKYREKIQRYQKLKVV